MNKQTYHGGTETRRHGEKLVCLLREETEMNGLLRIRESDDQIARLLSVPLCLRASAVSSGLSCRDYARNALEVVRYLQVGPVFQKLASFFF